MKFLDGKQAAAVVWDRHTFGLLEIAVQGAPSTGRPNIVIDFGRRWGRVEFTWEEATNALAVLAKNFAVPDQPTRENKEGREP